MIHPRSALPSFPPTSLFLPLLLGRGLGLGLGCGGAGEALAASVGCGQAPDPAGCLRKQPLDELLSQPKEDVDTSNPDVDLANVWDLSHGPTTDGWVLPKAPLEAFASGEHNRVPLAIGSNAHEMEVFLPPTVHTCQDYEARIEKRFGAHAAAVLERYPCDAYLFPRWAAVDVSTDLLFGCTARRVARAVSAAQNEPVYRYVYEEIADYGPLRALRAFHAAELPYVFRTHEALGYKPTSGELALSSAIQGYWARFASAGDPNGAGAFPWPEYGSDEDVLVLDEEPAIAANPKGDACDFWDALLSP